MLRKFSKRFASASLALFAAGLLLTVAHGAQRTRNRPSRRQTNPVRTQPPVPVPSPSARATGAQTSSDPTLISSAEDDQDAASRTTTTRRPASRTRRNNADAEEQENLRRTVNRLSGQVTRLSEDLGQLKESQRTLVDLERLSRAEQRAEGFRAQLRDVLEKELNLQARLEQIEYDVQPENVQRRSLSVGTLRPDDLRAEMTRQLENERRRVQTQLDMLATSRVRLEAAVAVADTEVEKLRARLNESDTQEILNRRNANNTEAEPTDDEAEATTTAPPIQPTR